MEVTGSVAVPPAGAPREPRALDAGHGFAWWKEGWTIFTAAPLPWVLMIVVLLLVMLALTFVPIVGGIAQTILAPVFAGGMLLGCNALARGEPVRVGHLFEGFQAGRVTPLLIIGLVNLAFAFVVWLAIVLVVIAVAGTAGLFQIFTGDLTEAGTAVLGTLGFAILVLAAISLVGFGMLAMAYWYAPQLVLFNGMEPIAAMKLSFRASWVNIGAFVVYGLLFILFAIVASIPFGLGWLVLGPVMVGSWYASWRETFGA